MGQIRYRPAGMECVGRATLGAKIPRWLLEILQSQQTGILPKTTASARTRFYGKTSDRFCSHNINKAPSPQAGWKVVLLKLIVLSWFVVAEILFSVLISPLAPSGFKLWLLSLKIPPGVISNKKEIPFFSTILLAWRRLQSLWNYTFCAFTINRFCHETDILPNSRVTKMRPYISANWCNYALANGTMLSLHYSPVAFFCLETSISLFIPKKHSR